MKHNSPPPSKLLIRSEVLSVIEFLTVVDNPPKQDKIKHLKRLSGIEDRQSVLEILVKELTRPSNSRGLQVTAELLMELGNIQALQDPLWNIIKSPESKDEVKDSANLILRHLGDDADPDLYLDYLEDPHGLISRETERMLEVSARNPEALIDFIDFIFSLPVTEQCNLINSLHSDYESEYLVNIYIPIIWADPPLEVMELVFRNIGKSRSKRACLFLEEMLAYYKKDEDVLKWIRKSVNELRLAGVYKEDQFDAYRQELASLHPLSDESSFYECYVTLADGIGNQGVVISRQKPNGDVSMMSVAINDLHGVIDCFGFYQLSEDDFHKIIEKFHEESSKIKMPESYCRQKLEAAVNLNRGNRARIPYEYTCWQILFEDAGEDTVNLLDWCAQKANPDWAHVSSNLYQHPDFSTWFLEDGDHPIATEILKEVTGAIQRVSDQSISEEQFLLTLETYGELIAKGLMETDWRNILTRRLAEASYLLHHQKIETFAKLAATEVMKLIPTDLTRTEEIPHIGFIRQYGRRCVEEQLLKLKQAGEIPTETLPAIDRVLAAWDIEKSVSENSSSDNIE